LLVCRVGLHGLETRATEGAVRGTGFQPVRATPIVSTTAVPVTRASRPCWRCSHGQYAVSP